MSTRWCSTRSHCRASEQETNKSAVTDHALQANHVIDWDAAKYIVQEDNKYKHWIQEAIWIRRKAPTMNRDEGAYSLSDLWTGLVSTIHHLVDISFENGYRRRR